MDTYLTLLHMISLFKKQILRKFTQRLLSIQCYKQVQLLLCYSITPQILTLMT